jgi:hypothetical protein
MGLVAIEVRDPEPRVSLCESSCHLSRCFILDKARCRERGEKGGEGCVAAARTGDFRGGEVLFDRMKPLVQGVYDLLSVWSGELSREGRWVLGGQAVGSWVVKRVLVIGVALGLLSGCGESAEEKAGSGFVSVPQAKSYFRAHYGPTSKCWPHERMDFSEWQLAGKPKERIWGSVSCRLGRTYNTARAAHIYAGEVLTYGIP